MLARFRLPDSRLLKILCGFFAAGLCTKVVLSLFQKQDTLSDKVGSFFTELMLPYIYGAFGSEFLLVWLGAAMMAAVFALAACQRGSRPATIAKGTLTVLLLLSLFTVWIEPFVSISAAVSSTLMTLAKVPMKLADIGVSIFWVVMLRRAMNEIDEHVAGREEQPTLHAQMHANAEAEDSLFRTDATNTHAADGGVIVLRRPQSVNQALYGVTVLVDGKRVGKLRNGESMTFRWSSGMHRLTVRYSLFTRSMELQVTPGDEIVIEQTFGVWIASPRLTRV